MNTEIYDIQTIRAKLLPLFSAYGVVKCGLYGSYARGEATPESNINLMFTLGRHMSLKDWAVFERDMETALDKDVHMVEFGALSPRIAREVAKELVVLYDESR